MKTARTLVGLALMGMLLQGAALAQEIQREIPPERVVLARRNMGGPRFGVTVVPGNSELSRELKNQDMGRVFSQFGWHFEHQVLPAGGGPQFVVEFVPMMAGVEYGKFIPNLTLAMGIRTVGGWELGMGPNLFFAKDVEEDVEARSSLTLAVGKSMDYGGVSIPFNLAYTTNPDGGRISFIVGYAIGSRAKAVNGNGEKARQIDSSAAGRL